jgi:hypothetical protein
VLGAADWTGTLDGTGRSWNDDGNWSAGFPNGAGAAANISGDITADTDIALNETITVGSLTLADTAKASVAAVEIEGGTSGSLIFDNNGSAATITNDMNEGDSSFIRNTVSSITLNDDLEIALADGTLEIAADIGETGGAKNLTVVSVGAGNDSLKLSGNCTFTGTTTMRGGNSSISGSIASDLVSYANRLGLGNNALSPARDVTVEAGSLMGGINTVRNFTTRHTGLAFFWGTMKITGSLRPGGTNAVGVFHVMYDNAKQSHIYLTNATFETEIDGLGSCDCIRGGGNADNKWVFIDNCAIEIRFINGFEPTEDDAGATFVIFDEMWKVDGTPVIVDDPRQNWSFSTRPGDVAGRIDGVLTFDGFVPLGTVVTVW